MVEVNVVKVVLVVGNICELTFIIGNTRNVNKPIKITGIEISKVNNNLFIVSLLLDCHTIFYLVPAPVYFKKKTDPVSGRFHHWLPATQVTTYR